MKKLSVSLLVVFLTGCQAMAYGTADDFNKLSDGMDKSQVIQILGQPLTTTSNADKHEETLVYRRMPHVVSWGPSSYVAVFRDGKLARYGLPDLLPPVQ